MQMEAECSYFLVRLPCVMRWQYTVMRGYAVCGKLRQGQTGQVREPFLDGPVLPRYCLEVLKMAACAVAVLTAMLLRAGAEVAQSEAPDPFVSFGSLNRAFAVLDESPEYIERFRSLDPGEDTAAIDGALAAIFPEGATRDEAGVLRILSYAAQAIRLEATTTPLGSEVLKQGHAYCNGIAIAFVALCRRAGLPARVNAVWPDGNCTCRKPRPLMPRSYGFCVCVMPPCSPMRTTAAVRTPTPIWMPLGRIAPDVDEVAPGRSMF